MDDAAHEDQFGFGFAAPERDASPYPNPDHVREDAHAIIEAARAVSAEAPWDAKTLHYNRLVFPHLASWLPKDEAEQLCFAFAQEAERIELMLAA